MELRGLTWEEVAESRLKYGSNQIKLPPRNLRRHRLKSLFEITQLIILTAMVSIGIGSILGQTRWEEGLGWQLLLGTLFLIIVRNQYLKKPREVIEEQTWMTLYREGREIELAHQELVVGDLVKISVGQEIPADGFLVQGTLQVNIGRLPHHQSQLMRKHALSDMGNLNSVKWNCPMTEQSLMDDISLFKGMIVEEGEGILYVRRVGMNTLFGSVSIKS